MNERPQRQTPKPYPSYAAFLVRCWREGDQWRIVLEDVTTRERRGFKTLEALLATLQASLNKEL
jgi:hypothetical protein